MLELTAPSPASACSSSPAAPAASASPRRSWSAPGGDVVALRLRRRDGLDCCRPGRPRSGSATSRALLSTGPPRPARRVLRRRPLPRGPRCSPSTRRARAREIPRVLRPGGRFALAVWGPRASNPWLTVVSRRSSDQLGRTVPPPGFPGPFSLADGPDRLPTSSPPPASPISSSTEVSDAGPGGLLRPLVEQDVGARRSAGGDAGVVARRGANPGDRDTPRKKPCGSTRRPTAPGSSSPGSRFSSRGGAHSSGRNPEERLEVLPPR